MLRLREVSHSNKLRGIDIIFVFLKIIIENSVRTLSLTRLLFYSVHKTKAKYQMICVGNFEWMLKSERLSGETVRALVQDAKDRRCF